MFSVTQRVENITQPRNGYLPSKSLSVYSYMDGKEIDFTTPIYSAFAAVQGMAVDYLTRFMSGERAEDAFSISMMGAAMMSDEAQAFDLLKRIKGIDRSSVDAACKLVQYDVVVRRGSQFYAPMNASPDNTIIKNIQIMVERSVAFLKKHSPLLACSVTFEGGYTRLISSGDGDYLTRDGIWDLKVSKKRPTSSETLQILTYYIMGCHSIHQEFRKIQTIGIFNPLLNQSFEINVEDIPADTYAMVGHDVLGLRIPDAPDLWREEKEEDDSVLRNVFFKAISNNTYTDFNPQNYDDGIFDISVDDYWTYFRDKSERLGGERPKFNLTDHIKFLKHDGFLMFVSVSEKESACILHGGFLRKLDKPIQYYYDMLPEYGNKILASFSKYWDAVYKISRYIKRVTDGQATARVHGCIIDLDFYDHIYINPIDGKITPYSATSVYDKKTYKNLKSLLADNMPALLESFQRNQRLEGSTSPSLANIAQISQIALTSSEIVEFNEVVYDTDMYAISNRLKALQLIYDYRLVAVWYEGVIDQPIGLPESEPMLRSERTMDCYIDDNLDKLVDTEIDIRSTRKKQKRHMFWKTKQIITQDELFGLIRKMLSIVAGEMDIPERIDLSCYWFSKKGSYREANCNCSTAEAKAVYKRLIKPREKYQSSVTIELALLGKKDEMAMSMRIGFTSKENPLALSGNFELKNGKMIAISESTLIL